jgi:uncharacterized membrane protein
MGPWVLVVLAVGLIALATPILALVTWLQLRRLEERLGGPALSNVTRLLERLNALETRVAELAAGVVGGAVRPDVSERSSASDADAVPVAHAESVAALPRPVSPSMPALPPLAAVPPAADLDLESRVAGRWLNRVGLLAVVVGVAFFLKYAIDNAWVGPAGQVSLGALLGVGLVAWSGRIRRAGHAYFADGLTGLGGAVMYLSLWAGGNFYALLPRGVAFAGMIAVTAALVAIAVGRGSQRVALLALIGGLVTPALLSTGADRQVALFVYLAVLNAAVLPVAAARGWRSITLPAFAGTQLYFWVWYGSFYGDDRWLSTAAFAALFFVQFFVFPVRGRAHGGRLRLEEAGLAFVNSGLLLIALRQVLWPEREILLTLSTLALAAAHLLMARQMPQTGMATRTAGESPARLLYAGLALTFATLSIFVGLDGPWIATAWAIEGAVLIWSGLRMAESRLRVSGLVLFALVGWRLLAAPVTADRFLFNPRLAVFLVVIGCAGAAVWWAFRAGSAIGDTERPWFWILGIGAHGLAILAMTLEIYEFFEPAAGATFTRDAYLAAGLTTSLAWTASASVLLYVGARRRIAGVRWLALALIGVTTVKVFLIDFAALTGIYRVISSLGLGVVLLIISFVYQRRVASAARDEVV